jgi:hypothetical protein
MANQSHLIFFVLRTGDVWAFGTTVWQIFSYGADPSSNQKPEEFIQTWRLDRPEAMTYPIYNDVILGCWRRNPDERKSARVNFRKQ